MSQPGSITPNCDNCLHVLCLKPYTRCWWNVPFNVPYEAGASVFPPGGGETEALTGEATCPGSHSWERATAGLDQVFFPGQ